jgi:hypothetical protein
VWQDKHAAIAATVENLSDGFHPRPALCNGWQVYVKRTYPASAGARTAAMIGQGDLVVDDSELFPYFGHLFISIIIIIIINNILWIPIISIIFSFLS